MPEQNDSNERVVPQSALFSNHIQFKVILADDTNFDGQAYLNSDDRFLFVRIFRKSGATMTELFAIFSDPTKTSTIKSQMVDTDDPLVFEGYTSFTGIKQETSGDTTITMMRRT